MPNIIILKVLAPIFDSIFDLFSVVVPVVITLYPIGTLVLTRLHDKVIAATVYLIDTLALVSPTGYHT